ERGRRPTRARVARHRLLALRHAAERGAQDHAHAPRRGVEVGAREQVVRCGEKELRGAAAAPPLALELLDLAAQTDAQVIHGEALDARDGVRPGDKPHQNASTSPSGVTTPAATIATGSVRRRTTPDV